MLRLEDFHISPDTGFLSPDPLRRLPDAYYEPWESLVDDLMHLLVAGKLRRLIQNLPELSVDRMKDDRRALERAFLVLSLLAHAYVWGAKGEPVLQSLPRPISKPWLSVGAVLGMRPISCNAALVLFNYKKLSKNDPIDLDNIATLHTISGGIDESWFYLITVAIEAAGAKALPSILAAYKAMEELDNCTLADHLDTVAHSIADMTDTLERMPEHCDPHIFYHRVRIYFSGWTGHRFSQGLLYEGDEGEIERMFMKEAESRSIPDDSERDPFVPPVESVQGAPKSYSGGSAAQSSMIQALDIFLDIKHYATGQQTKSPSAKNFLHEMRYHMPASHRAFLYELWCLPSLRKYIQQISENSPKDPCVIAYNRCVENMQRFRDAHIRIVTRYIIVPGRMIKQDLSQEGYHGNGPQEQLSSLITNHEPPASVQEHKRRSSQYSEESLKLGGKGTGGTAIIPFLKQSRDETSAARMSL